MFLLSPLKYDIKNSIPFEMFMMITVINDSHKDAFLLGAETKSLLGAVHSWYYNDP